MKRLIACLLLASALAGVAKAQGLRARIQSADQRWEQCREALASSNPVAQSEALRAAMADENTGIRNNALWFTLRNRTSLPVALVLPPGGRLDPADAPALAVERVTWDSDQRTLLGFVMSQGVAGPVTGGLVEGTLQLRFQQLFMGSDFGAGEDQRRSRHEIASRTCNAVLSISLSDRALTGPVRCERVSQAFVARLPLE